MAPKKQKQAPEAEARDEEEEEEEEEEDEDEEESSEEESEEESSDEESSDEVTFPPPVLLCLAPLTCPEWPLQLPLHSASDIQQSVTRHVSNWQ